MSSDKEFKLEHLFFKGDVQYFTELNPPVWLVSLEYKWWYKSHVLKLELGESIDSDFRRITRVNIK